MALQIEDFLQGVKTPLEKARRDFDISTATKLVASDSQGQKVGFVDVVMEGGGVKGITTAGALYALEKMGFRFRKVAGTSAGSIAAALLTAAGQDALDRKVGEITKILANLDFFKFVDGGSDARALLNAYNNPDSGNFFTDFLKTMRKGISIVRNVQDVVGDLGINPGSEFKAFITGTLQSLNGHDPFTGEALSIKLKKHLPRLESEYRIEGNFTPKDFTGDFQVVVADLSFQRKAVFPRDGIRYFKDPNQVLIGDYIRASMSIPVFFAPFKLSDFDVGEDQIAVSPDVTFVDGGLVSNFPLSLFDSGGKPRCPTFGLLIDEQQGKKPVANKIDNLFELGMAMFDTTREYGDKAYVAKNPHAESRIIRMSNLGVGNKPVNTTDFNLKDEDKIQLFHNGVNAVLKKMQTWNFGEYIRKYRL